MMGYLDILIFCSSIFSEFSTIKIIAMYNKRKKLFKIEKYTCKEFLILQKNSSNVFEKDGTFVFRNYSLTMELNESNVI